MDGEERFGEVQERLNWTVSTKDCREQSGTPRSGGPKGEVQEAPSSASLDGESKACFRISRIRRGARAVELDGLENR
jgi:hypothetical protein